MSSVADITELSSLKKEFLEGILDIFNDLYPTPCKATRSKDCLANVSPEPDQTEVDINRFANEFFDENREDPQFVPRTLLKEKIVEMIHKKDDNAMLKLNEMLRKDRRKFEEFFRRFSRPGRRNRR